MSQDKKQSETVDEYIKAFPEDVQMILQKIRQTIAKVTPEAVEVISYGIPTFKLNGKYLIYFAGWTNYISLYPLPVGSKAFQREISPFVSGKGTVRFPIDKPVPYDLVKKMVQVRLGRPSIEALARPVA